MKNACSSSAPLLHPCSPRIGSGNGITYHPQCTDPPTLMNEIKIISHRHAQRSVSQVILDSVTLAINLDCYTKDDFEPPHPLPSSFQLLALHVYTTTLGSILISKGGNGLGESLSYSVILCQTQHKRCSQHTFVSTLNWVLFSSPLTDEETEAW